MNRFTQQTYLINTPAVYDETAEFYLPFIGHFQSHGHFNWHTVNRKITVHFIVNGTGTVECDGCKHQVSSGDWFIFWPDKHIHYYDQPDTPWSYYWFPLSGVKADELFTMAGFSVSQPHITATTASRSFLAAITHAVTRIRSKNYSTLYPVSLAWQILELMANAIQSSLHDSNNNLAEECRMLMENFQGNYPTVAELARRLNVERSTLFRLFKQHFGMSPKSYLEQLRFERVKQFLGDNSLSLKEIAVICGFEQPQYFSNAFKKYCGQTPSAYRQASKKRGLRKRRSP